MVCRIDLCLRTLAQDRGEPCGVYLVIGPAAEHQFIVPEGDIAKVSQA